MFMSSNLKDLYSLLKGPPLGNLQVSVEIAPSRKKIQVIYIFFSSSKTTNKTLMHFLLHIISKAPTTEVNSRQSVQSKGRKGPGIASSPEENTSSGSTKGSHTFITLIFSYTWLIHIQSLKAQIWNVNDPGSFQFRHCYQSVLISHVIIVLINISVIKSLILWLFYICYSMSDNLFCGFSTTLNVTIT